MVISDLTQIKLVYDAVTEYLTLELIVYFVRRRHYAEKEKI